jgi:hypothetical protein
MKTWGDLIDANEAKYAWVSSLLQQYGELEGKDLTGYYAYGSALRPMSHAWARIDDAVYMQSDRQETGYHTVIATPTPLLQSTIKQFELTTL